MTERDNFGWGGWPDEIWKVIQNQRTLNLQQSQKYVVGLFQSIRVIAEQEVEIKEKLKSNFIQPTRNQKLLGGKKISDEPNK